MAFFLIVPSVIIVSIILIRGVANYVGIKISYGALFICAVLSFAALFGAIKLSPNPDKFFFVHLGALILPAALIVTILNHFFIRRNEDNDAEFTEEVRRAYAQKSDENISSSKIAKVRLKNVSAQVENKIETSKPFEDEKIFDATDEIFEDDEKFDVNFDTLEELLDYAKAEKSKGNIAKAINAYKKALEEYREDDYAPFVAIDLSAIYREQAAYTKAIKVYEDALNLSAVKKNSAVMAEFKKKLAYIKTVQAILWKHRALTTPFSKIPKEYLREIELDFKETSK